MYEETEGGHEVAYVQEAWNNTYRVRRLDPKALLGKGAMLASNKNRVYDLDCFIALKEGSVRLGYLENDG